MKIFVKAKANSKVIKCEEIGFSHFAVWVREPAKDGQANISIQEALAVRFGVAPSRVRIVSGYSSRNKVFEII